MRGVVTRARLELPCGTLYVGRITAGDRKKSGRRKVVLFFEIDFEVKGGEKNG